MFNATSAKRHRYMALVCFMFITTFIMFFVYIGRSDMTRPGRRSNLPGRHLIPLLEPWRQYVYTALFSL